MIAAIGANLVEDWYLPRQIVQRQVRVEPNPAAVARYDDGYRLFREAQTTFTPLAHRLSAAQRRPA
jgi:hypothetical protein